LFGLGIGVTTIAIVTGVTSLAEGLPLNLRDELPIFLLQAILVAIPFLLMALLGIVGRLPWLMGIGLTAALWAYVVYDGLASRGDGTGVNIGLGLLVLASPILISFVCVLPGRRELRGETHGRDNSGDTIPS